MNYAMILLCGGKSTRLGTDKALLPFGGSCLIEYLVKKYQPLFSKIYLSVQQKGDYSHLNLPVTEIQDMYLNAGPFGGIFSSLSMIREEKAFVLSVDTPFVRPELAVEMLQRSDDSDLCVLKLHHGFYEGFCGVYSKECILSIGKSLLLKQLTISTLTEKCRTAYILEDELEKICGLTFQKQFFSISTRADYYESLRRLHVLEPKAFLEEIMLEITEKKEPTASEPAPTGDQTTVLHKIPMLKNLFE